MRMERSVICISIVMTGWVVASCLGAEYKKAFWARYEAEENNWDLVKANAYCSQFPDIANKPYAWRSKYYWTAFCGTESPKPPASCGYCLNVTNTVNGLSLIVRIVDLCYIPSLVLDYPAFEKIMDEDGRYKGHLNVSYDFVDCADEPSIRLNTAPLI